MVAPSLVMVTSCQYVDETDEQLMPQCSLSRKQTHTGKDNVERETNPNVVHQHLVEADWSEGALDDVGDGCCGHDYKEKREVANS